MTGSDAIARVAETLARIGGNRHVPFEVTCAAIDGRTIRLELTLRYVRASPVCCGEPACYIGFLGRRRHEVAPALAAAFGLAREPAVSITVRMQHEADYQHVNLATGEPAGAGTDGTLVYDEAHFARAGSASAGIA